MIRFVITLVVLLAAAPLLNECWAASQAVPNIAEIRNAVLSNGYKTMDEVLGYLKGRLNINETKYTLIRKSGSSQQASDSDPRVLVVSSDSPAKGGKADRALMFTFNGDPSQAGYNSLEIVEFADGKFTPAEIIFDTGPGKLREQVRAPRFVENPRRCYACHRAGNTADDNTEFKPIWDDYAIWHGYFRSVSNLGLFTSQNEKDAFTEIQRGSLAQAPRYRHFLDSKDNSYVIPEALDQFFSQANLRRDQIKFVDRIRGSPFRYVFRLVARTDQTGYLSGKLKGFPQSLMTEIDRAYQGSEKEKETRARISRLSQDLGADENQWRENPQLREMPAVLRDFTIVYFLNIQKRFKMLEEDTYPVSEVPQKQVGQEGFSDLTSALLGVKSSMILGPRKPIKYGVDIFPTIVKRFGSENFLFQQMSLMFAGEYLLGIDPVSLGTQDARTQLMFSFRTGKAADIRTLASIASNWDDLNSPLLSDQENEANSRLFQSLEAVDPPQPGPEDYFRRQKLRQEMESIFSKESEAAIQAAFGTDEKRYFHELFNQSSVAAENCLLNAIRSKLTH